MPHWLQHDAIIAGRVLAGLIGALCFYIAFFMYEDEGGQLQNRIDELWMSIYDRSKVTHSVSVALFNRIAQIIVRALNHMFGQKLLSLRMTCVSSNLSIVGGVLLMLADDMFSRNPQTHKLSISFSNLPEGLLYLAPFAVASFISMKFPKRIIIILCLLPCLALWVAAILITIPYLYNGFASPSVGGYVNFMMPVYEAAVFVFALSIFFDMLAIVVIRKVFLFLAEGLAISRTFWGIVFLVGVFFVILPLPYFAWLHWQLADGIKGHIADIGYLLCLTNATTTLYCLVPMLVLLVVLLHRISWPTLSRMLYPLSRFNLLLNKKAMVALGSFLSVVAFLPSQVRLEKFLKLFG